jgi:aspartyl protease family protein
MRNILAGLALVLAHAPASAADINVIALTAGKAVVAINNGKPQTMTAGQVSPEGVKLVSATSDAAIFEVAGRRQTLAMGHSISMGGDATGPQRATLIADSAGHFVTTVEINGISMRFIVDTGASLVTLSSDDAKRAGISYLAGQKATLQTANGAIPAYRVKLDRVRLADITLHNVDGVVVVGKVMGDIGLLGLSFLNRLEMKRDGQTMTLVRRY